MKYRKLTKQEAEQLLQKLATSKNPPRNHGQYAAYAAKYYPPEIESFLVSYNSEYNDEYYTGAVAYVVAYDKDGNELPPLKGTAKEARDQWRDLFCLNQDQFDDEIADKVIFLKAPTIPDFYVQE